MVFKAFLLLYLILSFVFALNDVLWIHAQDKYLHDIELGDLNFQELNRILGIHNIIFLPGCLLIFVYLLIVLIINKIKSRM